MRWEELTYEELLEVAKSGAIAIIPLGSLEVHDPHLPLGTDSLAIYKVAIEAAKREAAVVLPLLYYACVIENRHFPGTISISAHLLLKLLEEICDEIARNGFHKILIINGHGGNRRILRLFAREFLWKHKGYQIYILYDPWAPIQDIIGKVCKTSEIGHACEVETSYMLYLFPKLVKMNRVRSKAQTGKTPSIPFVETPVDWTVYCVMGYVGDPRRANPEKGKLLFEEWVRRIAEVIRLVKEDKVVEKALNRYFESISHA